MRIHPLHTPMLALSLAAACLLGGCGKQAENSPPPDTAASAPPPVTPAPPAGAASAPSGGQDASVAELLSGSNAPAADGTPAPAAASPTATTGQAGAAAPASSSASAPASTQDVAPAIDDVDYARVVSVSKISGPRQVCTDRTVVERRKPEDERRVAGTVIGAIAGGLIGNKIGRGRGRTVATVGGAVAGGAIGREVQGAHQDRDTVTRVVKHCRPVTPSEEGQVLYDVVYSYQSQNFHVRLDYDPGDRIALPVRGVD